MPVQKFFKLFPPPKFLNIPYAGLDISDDAIRSLEYRETRNGLVIHRFGEKILAPGIIVGGDIKNPEALTETIRTLAKESKIFSVKASLPEEKLYLFKTEVPSVSKHEIYQNIEFKLEENVPLSAADSIFYFDLLPEPIERKSGEGQSFASVSVAPQNVISAYSDIIRAAGLTVLSFELQAKALARALVPPGSTETRMILHIMDNKTGVYIVSGAAVCFTSTIAFGNKIESNVTELRKQLRQISNYWIEKGGGLPIRKLVLTGKGALADGLVSGCSPDSSIKAEIASVWKNASFSEQYVPRISYEESLDYAVAAGLALP